MPAIEILPNGFGIDGKPVQIISGAMHYFRVPREYWRDLLEKARSLGLNCIETYVAWNVHEPHPGRFDFSGMLDFSAYLDEIQTCGLYAIVRPGPYICAEWDNGGLPGWLMAEPGVKMRCMNTPYLGAVERYFARLLPMLAKHQYTRGGCVIAVQVENEYGSYGCDHEYLEHLRRLYVQHGLDVPFFTSDGPTNTMLAGGTIPECLQTVNFGSHAKEAFAKSREYRPAGPDFCMEFWNGWFDHWGETHHTRDAADAAAELDAILGAGASVNLYMFHGGTNFGFTNGANGNGLVNDDYAPTVTSYDYDSPLSESGDITPKYLKFQEVIRKYRPDAPFGRPADMPKKAYSPVRFTGSVPLFAMLDRLSTPRRSVTPLMLEELGETFGFVYYKTRLAGPEHEFKLRFLGVNDRVIAHLDGNYLGTVYRNDAAKELAVAIPAGGADLELLVENTGHINYGPLVGVDFKGITGSVMLELQSQFYWENRALPLDRIDALEFGEFKQELNVAAFHRGTLTTEKIADTFIDLPGVKGMVWVNGVNLGRYWNIGPTRTLYLPGAFLHPGANEIVVLELHALNAPELRFLDSAVL